MTLFVQVMRKKTKPRFKTIERGSLVAGSGGGGPWAAQWWRLGGMAVVRRWVPVGMGGGREAQGVAGKGEHRRWRRQRQEGRSGSTCDSGESTNIGGVGPALDGRDRWGGGFGGGQGAAAGRRVVGGVGEELRQRGWRGPEGVGSGRRPVGSGA
ncbi:uncharacterized protein LOC131875144 [Cryptomeria japonica]|uniref:uncharacterized protein LOC131875144 n=1 Tax=Cryptomeria japonica TaxID=3369 RepID=UPI0027DA05EA|nr:uncharacterized protein LOC131875144 [Cryptomeria japonica]